MVGLRVKSGSLNTDRIKKYLILFNLSLLYWDKLKLEEKNYQRLKVCTTLVIPKDISLSEGKDTDCVRRARYLRTVIFIGARLNSSISIGLEPAYTKLYSMTVFKCSQHSLSPVQRRLRVLI